METALLISLGGIVLAVSIPTFFRAMRSGKITEASMELERLYQLSAAYYASPQRHGDQLSMHCLPPAAGPAPSRPSQEPVDVDFAADETPGAATWRALGFQPERGIRFRYSFIPREAGCGLQGTDSHGVPFLILRAEGDLNGDGELSVFERTAKPNAEGQLVPDGALLIHNRVD